MTVKRNILSICLGAVVVLSSAFQSGDTPCDAKALKDKSRKTLEPFKYDMAKLTRIMYKDKPSLKEIEIPLFIGEKYKMVINTEALPRPVEVNIYNRDKDSKKRKLLFSSKGAPEAQREFTFEISFAMKAFVDYNIPAGDSAAASGCVVLMLGYK